MLCYNMRKRNPYTNPNNSLFLSYRYLNPIFHHFIVAGLCIQRTKCTTKEKRILSNQRSISTAMPRGMGTHNFNALHHILLKLTLYTKFVKLTLTPKHFNEAQRATNVRKTKIGRPSYAFSLYI